MRQDVSITSGLTYHWEFYKQIIAADNDNNNLTANIWFSWTYTSENVPFAGWLGNAPLTTDTAYGLYNGFAVAPAGTSGIRINLNLQHNNATAGCVSTMDVDDISIKQVYSDDYDGDYLVLLRCRVDTGEVDVYGRYGYEGTSTRPKFGKTQAITHTDWKLVPLGVVSIPPERRLRDEESFWRINKLCFDISAEEISGTPTFDMDALLLVPWDRSLYTDDVSICRSSYQTGTGEYMNADLHVYRTPLDEMVIIAEDESFGGVDTNIRWSENNWTIPAEDCILVAFAQRDASHQIADDFLVTLDYYPRYMRRVTT
jgi:hypothetical protein